MNQKSFAKNNENNYFVKILVMATFEPRMILILFYKFSLFEPQCYSSAVF